MLYEKVFNPQYNPQYKVKHFHNASLYNSNINISSITFLFLLSSRPQKLCHLRISSLIIGMIMIRDLIETFEKIFQI